MDRGRQDAVQPTRLEHGWSDTRFSDAKWSDATPCMAPSGRFAQPMAPAQPVAPSSELVQAIEHLVIPRLLVAHPRIQEGIASRTPAYGPEPVANLMDLVLARDFVGASVCADRIQSPGASFETVCLDVLAPAARRLGQLWDDDRCSFADVTIGLGRLQRVMHELRNISPAFPSPDARPRRALLMPLPGSQHTFGLAIVIEFFRREGWSVDAGACRDMSDVARTVRDQAYDIAGISASCGSELQSVAACIRTIRRSTCNPAIGVMVGGAAFAADPSAARRVGADTTAPGADSAVRTAERLVRRTPRSIA